MINTDEVYKTLSPIEGRALVYQRLLLAQDPDLKLELLKTLKNIFEKDGIGNAFEEELKIFLTQIEKEDIPSNFTTFYENYIKTDEVIEKKIKYNNKILHQSKLVNYLMEIMQNLKLKRI